MLSAADIVDLHDDRCRLWHLAPQAAEPSTGWLAQVAEQHRANYDLWHIEDEARVPNAPDSELARVKRLVDKTNQRRNDLAEKLDLALLTHLEAHALPAANAPLHSESPGLMIDRLSILSLKIHHTREEVERPNAPAGHAERNQARLTVLIDQCSDLAACLDDLWQQTLHGQRRFKLYRQLKMYNDPSLNPAVYRSGT